MSPAAGSRTESTPACCWREYPGFPDLARLHAAAPRRYPHLLESVAHGPPQARYDILLAFPGRSIRLTASGQLEGGAGVQGAHGAHGFDAVLLQRECVEQAL